MSDEEEQTATYCPDCQACFPPGEEGFGWEECIECGQHNCFEIPY